MSVRAFCLALSLSLFAVPEIALAQEAVGDAAAGRLAAQTHCGACHATAAGQSRSPHPGAKPFALVAQRPELNAMTLSVWVKSSHPNMPLLRLEADTIEDMAAYMLSLRPPKAPG